jgi:hypothetical protein
MTKPSIFSRFKLQPYYLELDDEWLMFSVDSKEEGILEKIVSEKDDKLFLVLNRRYGIHPSENEYETVKPKFDDYTDSAKKFFGFLDNISIQTGLTRVEILLRMPEDLSDLEAEIQEKASQKDKTSIEINNELREIKKKLKNESKDITELLKPYIDQLNSLSEQYEKSMNDYYIALSAYFLSGKRILVDINGKVSPVSVAFDYDNVRSLHIDFQRALIGFINNELNRWSEGEGKN